MYYSKTMIGKKIFINGWMAIALLTGGTVCAQPSCRATLPEVPADGYYAIDLPYAVLGHAREDYADLRITDRNGREIAWLLRGETERIYAGGFQSFPVDIEATAKETSVLITTGGKALSSFTLRMKNADANKYATLKGSNDRKAWYAVKDHLALLNISNRESTEAYVQLDFPLSDYQYYKLTIGDSLSAPLNIRGVGVMKEGYSLVPHLLDVPVKESVIRTEGKQTDVLLVLPYETKVADVVFHISSPTYYNRDVKIWLPTYHRSVERRSLLKARKYITWQNYTIGTLAADSGRPVTLSYDQYTDTLRMEVFNKDDQPLKIDSIKVYAKKLYLVAGLKAGEVYQLTCGDEEAVYPQYDLSFAAQLPDSLQHLTLGNIEQQSITEDADPVWWEAMKTYGIWIIIVFIVLQILYIVRKMLKQNPKQS